MAFTLHELCYIVFSSSKCINTLLVSYCFWWCGIFFFPISESLYCIWGHLIHWFFLFKYHFLFVKTYKKQKKRMNELMNGKRAIGYGAFYFNLWMVKASWLVGTKMYEKDVILVLNLMVLLICLVYLWFLWENVWLCFLLLWESSVSHLLEFSAITLTIHCHVVIWEIPWHQCFTAQLIDASLPMHCGDPHARLQHV